MRKVYGNSKTGVITLALALKLSEKGFVQSAMKTKIAFTEKFDMTTLRHEIIKAILEALKYCTIENNTKK